MKVEFKIMEEITFKKKLCFFQWLFSDSKIIVKGMDLLIPLKLLLAISQAHRHDWSTFLPDDDGDDGAF